MPQFDTSLFVPQLFWLAIVFVVLMILMWRLALPKVGEVVVMREERIQGNLGKAEALKAEAENALAGYQKAIADARTAAQAEQARAASAIAAETAKRETVFGKRLDDESTAAESRIGAAKSAALASVKSIATDLSQAMTGKLIGASIGGDAAADAVGAALKERG
ncbi:MAG TPA: F0F1 ATP synthase subunit B' [Candidatus Binatia bacterium]|nr:F0F1 ATP synthase subunit B' [Candidatus Binatia bacterium]